MRGCKRNTGNIWCETTVFACKLLAHPMTTDLPRRRATEGVDSALLALVSAANRQMARSVCQLLIRPLWKHQISSLKLWMEEGVLEVRNSPHVRQFSAKELHEATAGFAKKLGRFNGTVYERWWNWHAVKKMDRAGFAESQVLNQGRCPNIVALICCADLRARLYTGKLSTWQDRAGCFGFLAFAACYFWVYMHAFVKGIDKCFQQMS